VGRFIKGSWVHLLLGFLILILFFARIYKLTLLPVFADEAIYIRWSQVMKAEETLRFLPLSDGKEPLFMWIVIPFLKIIHDPLVAGRMVSVLSGFGTLAGICFLSYLLFKNKKVVLAAGVIYSVSPFSFFFDRMALVDSMLAFFGIWTFIFSYLAATRRRLDFAMLAGFALGGAWLTKSPALFFALMLPTLWLFARWEKSFRKNIFVFLTSLSFVTVLIGYGIYNILRLGPNFHLIASRNLDYVYPLSHLMTSPLDPLIPFLLQVWQWTIIMGPWPLLILAAFGIVAGVKKNWKELLVMIIWFLAPIFIQSEFARVFTARYIFFTIPYLVIIAASVFLEERQNRLNILVFILAFFIAQAVLFDCHLLTNPQKANLPRSERSGYLEEWTAGQGIREAAENLKTQMSDLKSGQKIVVGTEGYFGTLPDGLQIYLNNLPDIIVIGTGLDFTKLPQSLAESQKSGNKTYLVVNDERFHSNAQGLGLKLLASYPKAKRPDGTNQSLLFFELTNP
jgi:4-amino-4-deoxy-L-arabinose transferase-like glycosyltransferase